MLIAWRNADIGNIAELVLLQGIFKLGKPFLNVQPLAGHRDDGCDERRCLEDSGDTRIDLGTGCRVVVRVIAQFGNRDIFLASWYTVDFVLGATQDVARCNSPISRPLLALQMLVRWMYPCSC